MTRYCEFEHNAISPVLTLYSCSIIQSSTSLLRCGWLRLFPVSASSNSKGANESFETLLFERNVGTYALLGIS